MQNVFICRSFIDVRLELNSYVSYDKTDIEFLFTGKSKLSYSVTSSIIVEYRCMTDFNVHCKLYIVKILFLNLMLQVFFQS